MILFVGRVDWIKDWVRILMFERWRRWYTGWCTLKNIFKRCFLFIFKALLAKRLVAITYVKVKSSLSLIQFMFCEGQNLQHFQ